MKQKFNLWIFLVLCLGPLNANTLRLNVGFWPGNLEPELENRFFLDNLIEGSSIGSLNLPWANKNTNTIYPLGFQYFLPVGKNQIVIGANFIYMAPEYRYTSIAIPPTAVNLVQLKEFAINDLEGELGYQITTGKIIITPKLGFRYHRQNFTNSELIIGQVFGFTVGKNDFSAVANGNYLGLDFQYKIDNQLSFIVEYLNTMLLPGFSGSMEYKTTTFITSGALLLTNQSSSYDVKISRWKLGLQYDIDKTKFFQFGIRTEEQTHSYPGYFNIPIVIIGNNANIGLDIVSEIISDNFIWQKEEKQEKGLIYFAFGIDLNL